MDEKRHPELSQIEMTLANYPPRKSMLIRVAHRIQHSQGTILGLWPAGARVPVPPLGIHLGMAIYELTGSTVAFVDANARWPTFKIPPVAQKPTPKRLSFYCHWIHQSFALIFPNKVCVAGAGIRGLRQMLDENRGLFSRILVDLTGFDRLGEHLEALSMMDGVLLVGRARHTLERELIELNNELPPEKNLGVVLVN